MTDPHYLHPAIAFDPLFLRFRGLDNRVDDETALTMAERVSIMMDSGAVEAHAAAQVEYEWLTKHPRGKV